MFRDSVTYQDFNNRTVTDELWFNISKTDVLEDISLIERAEAVERLVRGEERELDTAEKQQVLDMVKEFMKLAYGKKSADGRHFRKSPEVWDDFRWSAAYDAYLLKLFTEPSRAAAFGANVLPQDVREQAIKEGRIQEDGSLPNTEPTDDRPQWLKENRAPSMQELQATDQKWHAEAFRLKSQQ